MHLKFLARGTGSAAAAAAYLLAEWDAAGTRRAAVEVLRGDPHKVAAVADSLPFKHRYTSGLVAWSPEDNPTPAEIERVVDEFEETAWAGLEGDRYVWSAVLHRDDDGGVHVHLFAARCELATGRSLNIAPPGWQKTFDPLRDALNFEHGWSRPDDPSLARPYRPSPYRAYLDAETLRAGWEVEPNPRELIGQHLMARVLAGTVTDRAGVVGALEGLGLEVTRQGEHYVTARHPETGYRWRLKGMLYERDFDREQFIRQQAPEPSDDREPADREDDAARAAEARQEVEEQRGQRAEYHQARYGRGSREGRARGRGARDAAGDVERESEPAAAGREGDPESLAGHLRQELGDEAVVAAEDLAAEREQELEAIGSAGAGDATACLAVLARVSEVHDRDRAAAGGGLASVVHAVRAGAEAAGRADRVLAGAGRVLAGAGRTARGCGDALDRAIRDAGPDLAELMRQRQEQRAVAVAGREQAVCATSPGSEWLDEVQQEVLGGADRYPTVAERARIVKAVEGRVGTHLAGLENSLAATSAGAALLREEYGEGGPAAAPLQSFAEREEVLERVAQQVDAQLEAREKALRRLGKRYLSEAEQARFGGVEGSPPQAERESRIRAVERLVGEELDRREEQVRESAGSDRPIEDAIDILVENGVAISGDGDLRERAQIIEMATDLLTDDLTDLEGEEAAILKEPAGGEERLRNARVKVTGSADREAKTFVEREAIIETVKLAIREEALPPLGQQYLSEAEQARTGEGPPTLAERESMVNAVEQRVTEELDRREKRLKASGRGAALLEDAFENVTGGYGSDLTRMQRSQIIDLAESWLKEALTECTARVERQLDVRGGDEVLIAALNKREPAWRQKDTLPEVLDESLDDVEEEPGRRRAAPWHGLVRKAEQKFPHATSQTWHEAGDGIDRSTATGSISQTLSDRARVRALAAEEPEPARARNLVQRVIDWLRAQVERLLRERAAAAEAEDRRKREAAAAAARQQCEAAAAAARQQRWNDLEAFPGAQDAASARFDRLEPGWRDKGSASRQCFNHVVGEIEERIDKSLNKQEERLRDRNRSWDYQERDRAENLLERACADVLGSGKKPSTWQERARVLDTADLLDVADRAFEAARHEVAERWAMKVTPPHHTVQEAAAAAVDLEVVRTPWDRAVAEAIVGGKPSPDTTTRPRGRPSSSWRSSSPPTNPKPSAPQTSNTGRS